MERVLGTSTGPAAGPTVVGIGGLHGNEPAGVRALQTVLEDLGRPGRGVRRGRFVAVAGNLPALRAGVRYLDRDLNRIWTNEPPAPGLRDWDVEALEQEQLRAVLDEVRAEGPGPVHVVDLHTTSGEGPPFVVLGDTLANRAFALALPVPLVLGLAEEAPGTLVEHLDGSGWVNLAFEAGPHDDPASVDRASAAIWLLLGAGGLLDPRDSRVRAARDLLSRFAVGLPRAVEMYHHHPVTPKSGFRMRPGFRSFQPVRRGTLLAHDRTGPVRAPGGGHLIMPLYQERGQEGFFVARPVNPTWLRISATLRRRRIDQILLRLPGVRRHEPEGIRLVGVARRLLRPQLLRLLGYRRRGSDSSIFVRSTEPGEMRTEERNHPTGDGPEVGGQGEPETDHGRKGRA